MTKIITECIVKEYRGIISVPRVVRKLKKKKPKHHPEAKGLIFIGMAVAMFLCLFSFSDGNHESNWFGLLGHMISYCLNYLFGIASYFVITFLVWMGWRLLKINDYTGINTKILYFSLFLSSMCILLNLIAETKWIDISFLYNKIYSETAVISSPLPVRYIRHNLGGVPFYYIYKDIPNFNLQSLLSDIGVCLTFSITSLVAFILLTDLSFFKGVKQSGMVFPTIQKCVVKVLKGLIYGINRAAFRKPKQKRTTCLAKCGNSRTTATPNKPKYRGSPTNTAPPPPYRMPTEKNRKLIKNSSPVETEEVDVQATIENSTTKVKDPLKKGPDIYGSYTGNKHVKSTIIDKAYTLPPISLLSDTTKTDQTGLRKELKRRADILEETLISFGIEAKVGHIYPGPTITSFEIHPAIGVKVQKIKSLENDIALNLQAKSIRIIAPIPGKAAVGIEIPSVNPQTVGFKEMLALYRNSQEKYNIPLLIGKTVSGEDVMCDLTKMPHCIIAGATGAGKSVCINAIIMSILMNASPDEIKLILIDPKKVELTPFSKLPHLISPVITEATGAYAALKWIVREMQFRYELFKMLGVRNIHAYNNRKRNKKLEESLEVDVPEKLYFAVCIIDEFADLILTSSADLETPIARIAQMARAVGIHLVLATQRPSREVITGLIKANFPTRIAFKVSSRINSQIILDENGAETLLGNGDLLFLPPGTSQLIRCQGVFIGDEDINTVVNHIVNKYGTKYLFESFDTAGGDLSIDSGDTSQNDPLYQKAVQVVLTNRVASTTFIQRKLKIGYARAASLMDEMEENGVVGPQEGAKPRKIFKDL